MIAVLVAVGGSSFGVTAWLDGRGAAQPTTVDDDAPAQQRWCACTQEQRLGHLLRYRMIVRRPDAAKVFRRSAQFANLPPIEQKRLRLLRAALQEVLERQPTIRRRALLQLHERARAEEAYRILERQAPERIIELRDRLRGQS